MYTDIIRKYRHMKRDEVQATVITALIERSYIDMTGENAAAAGYFDDFAANAPDYGTWLFIVQNRLWFVRGRANILSQLDMLLDPARESSFSSDYQRHFRMASIGSKKIDAILDWARRLKSSLSQEAPVNANGQAPAAARAGDKTILPGGDEPEGEAVGAGRILERVIKENGNFPERLTQYNLSRALVREAELLGDGAPRNAYWRSVVEKFKTEKNVYARHHVIVGYAKLIAAADGAEKNILLGELGVLLDRDGTFQELLLLEDIRAGKVDFLLPLLLRNW